MHHWPVVDGMSASAVGNDGLTPFEGVVLSPVSGST